MAQYQYNGSDRLALVDYVGPDVRRRMFDDTTVNDYTSWDRFGRTVKQAWVDYTSGTVLRDQFDYTYDSAGNRTKRDVPTSLVAGDDFDQEYTYDGLHRLDAMESKQSGTRAKEEDWTLDQMGNWAGFVQKSAGTTTLNQTRVHNKANEIDTDDDHGSVGSSITSSGGTPDWADPAYDAAGNMWAAPQPSAPTTYWGLTYDAWNRLVKVANVSSQTQQENEYDGLHRRIVRSVYSGGSLSHRIHSYYNDQWQVIEERKETGGTESANPLNQYVWHPHYVDALAMRRYDSDTSTSGAQRITTTCRTPTTM